MTTVSDKACITRLSAACAERQLCLYQPLARVRGAQRTEHPFRLVVPARCSHPQKSTVRPARVRRSEGGRTAV